MAYKPDPADESQIEGSDQWIVLQQLAHQQLTVGDVSELLDCGRTRSLHALYTLRSHGHVRNAGFGMWELMPQSGTSLQT